MALHDNPTTPGTSANTASESVRELNHATIDPRTCTLYDVYSVLGALGEISNRLQQAAGQMADVLSARLAAGKLTLENHDASTLESLVRDCHDELGNAANAAGRLAISLRSAHQHVAAITDESDSAVQSAAPHGTAPRTIDERSRHVERRPRRDPGRSI